MTSQIDEVIKWVTSMVGQIDTNDDVCFAAGKFLAYVNILKPISKAADTPLVGVLDQVS
jgi:hypothetical protein